MWLKFISTFLWLATTESQLCQYSVSLHACSCDTASMFLVYFKVLTFPWKYITKLNREQLSVSTKTLPGTCVTSFCWLDKTCRSSVSRGAFITSCTLLFEKGSLGLITELKLSRFLTNCFMRPKKNWTGWLPIALRKWNVSEWDYGKKNLLKVRGKKSLVPLILKKRKDILTHSRRNTIVIQARAFYCSRNSCKSL